ncbi:MAG: hypothetical protein CMF71_02315 [Magnetovibrio sp.]|nr:hypothetical protein [Magnetovibrio sp.]
MIKLNTIICLTIVVLLGSEEEGFSADFQEGLIAAQNANYAIALREFRTLAEQGHASAQYRLGLMYDNGRGVKQDSKESIRWYRKSVEQGHIGSRYTLGVMYANGSGVRQDNVYAHMWFNIAASSGDENGAINRDIIARRMSKEQLDKALKLARECVRLKYKGC